jgi:hypothetical protein
MPSTRYRCIDAPGLQACVEAAPTVAAFTLAEKIRLDVALQPTYVGSGKRGSQRTGAGVFYNYGNIILKYRIITRKLGILLKHLYSLRHSHLAYLHALQPCHVACRAASTCGHDITRRCIGHEVLDVVVAGRFPVLNRVDAIKRYQPRPSLACTSALHSSHSISYAD